jgi:predicted  nucleic acid-binding Zn-ribbon protein
MLTKDDLKNIGYLLDSKIFPLKEDISSLRKDFEDFTIVVKNQFDRVDERFDFLESDMDEMKSDINEMKDDISEMKGDIRSLTKIQTSQYQQIDKNTDDIRLLKTKLKLA